MSGSANVFLIITKSHLEWGGMKIFQIYPDMKAVAMKWSAFDSYSVMLCSWTKQLMISDTGWLQEAS